MKKYLILILAFLLVSCDDSEKQENNENKVATIERKTISKEEKMEQFKRRVNFRSIIRKGDFYSIKNMKEDALRYYLSAYSRLKWDIVLEKKVWDSYFDLKDFNKSYEYYKKIPSLEIDEKTKEKMILSLMYNNPRNLKEELEKINILKDQNDYYRHVFTCYNWIKNCIESLKSYTWSYEKIEKIKTAMYDFEKVWDTDPNSKYAILAGQFFENKDYLATVKIGEETLTKRPDYKSVLKLVWYAYYELWNYKKSNEFLQKYYSLDPKDVKTTYLLWIINFYLESYISSNLYFNAAVLNWYTPKIELEKRLAYNYYIIWDKKNMLKVFRHMLDEKDVTEDDYSVALYTSIEEKEVSKSMLWANKWVLKFPDSDNILAFRWWILRIKNKKEDAIKDLNKSLEMNPRNAIALLNLWIIESERDNFTLAKNYLKDAIEIDKNWTFWLKAQTELKQTEEKEKNQKEFWIDLSNSGQINN